MVNLVRVKNRSMFCSYIHSVEKRCEKDIDTLSANTTLKNIYKLYSHIHPVVKRGEM